MSDYGVKIGIKADTGIMLLNSNLLIPVDTRTRHTNPNSFRHIQTSKDCYKYSYFPRSITLWNQLPTTFTTADS
jgi:hypothetical protein